jgi:serine/threonine transporter
MKTSANSASEINDKQIEPQTLFQKLRATSLVKQIIVAIVLGGLIGFYLPEFGLALKMLGALFVNALKAVAPILVLLLVASSIANQKANSDAKLKPIVGLYLVGTLSAALISVAISFLFPVSLSLDLAVATANPPQGLAQVLTTLAFKIVDNPINAIATGNFIGILAWGLGLGFALKKGNETTKNMVHDLANAVSSIVKIVIRFAPLGILGLVAHTVADTGFTTLSEFSHLVILLLSAMLIIALVVNPAIVFFIIRKNPYPLVFTCLKSSGITAFFYAQLRR